MSLLPVHWAIRRSEAVSEAMKVFVAATLNSGPAAIGSTNSQACANGLFGIVDDGRGDGIGGARRGGRFDQIVARSGLRDREEQLILERKPAMIDAGDIRRRRRDREFRDIARSNAWRRSLRAQSFPARR